MLKPGKMPGKVDLHCHFVAAIDDGARTPEDGIAILRGLAAAGYDRVVATPHMRTGMFDNDRAALERAFAQMKSHVDAAGSGLPEIALASEHYFDDVVFKRLVGGEALPFPGAKKAVLVELPTQSFPTMLQHRFFDVRRSGLTVVLAHPERYRPVWDDLEVLEPLLDAGVLLQLDLCSLVGKYGKMAQRTAEALLEEDAYEIACTDTHKPTDLDAVNASLVRLEKLVGPGEANRLTSTAPRALSS